MVDTVLTVILNQLAHANAFHAALGVMVLGAAVVIYSVFSIRRF